MATKDNFFQTSDGVWLYYEVTGEGRPILFLPGFGESVTMWRHSVPVLSQNHKVICLDLRGHGNSMMVCGSNTQERMAQDIRELIDFLELKDVLLIGHSLGGSVVASYAELQNQHALRGMILVDASLHPFGNAEWNHQKDRGYNIEYWYKRMGPYMYQPLEFAQAYKFSLPAALEPEDAQLLYESLLKLPPWIGVEYQLGSYFTDNMTPLAKRTIPVATFVSYSDYYDFWDSGHEAVKRMTNSPLALCYEFTEAQHHLFPILEYQKFNSCILDFEEKIDSLNR